MLLAEEMAPPRKTLTPEQQAARNAEIVSARLRNLPWATIAQMYGMSERNCHKVFERYRESNPTLRHHDPIEVVDFLLDGYQGCLEELAVVSNTTMNDTVRVGAVNARMTALRQVAELLQAVGVLPHDLGQLRLQVEADVTIERVVSVLRKHSAPPELLNALVGALAGQDGSAAQN